MSFSSYPEYKDSGVPWLSQIPKHWKTLRLKLVFREIDNRSIDGNQILLSMTRKNGLIPQKSLKSAMNTNNNLIGYKICNPEEIVMNRMQAWSGMFFRSTLYGLVSPDYSVFRAMILLNAQYFENLFRTPYFVSECIIRSRGIGKGFNRLYGEGFGNIHSVFPPYEEQTAIARFLDWKTAQIARYIRAKQKMIALLKEQKQAIINDAVTGKIDVRTGKPYAEYKDSGVEWLGKIPVGWDCLPLKRIVKSNIEALSEITDPEYEFNYLEISNVKEGYVLQKPNRIRFKNAPSRARRIVKSGDTIISTVRTYLRSVCYISLELSKDLIVSTGFSVLHPQERINDEFLGYLLRGNNFIDRVIKYSIGVSYPAISDSKILCIKIALPNMQEQELLNKYISEKTENLDELISVSYNEIELMKEYRDRLIADAVTGKIDVRGIEAPEITPEEIEPDEAGEIEEETEIAEEEAHEGEE